MRLRHFGGVSLMSAATVVVVMSVAGFGRGGVRRAGLPGAGLGADGRGGAVRVRAAAGGAAEAGVDGAAEAGADDAATAGAGGAAEAEAGGAAVAWVDDVATAGAEDAATAGAAGAAGPTDFVEAARMVIPATVHVVAGGGDWQSVVSGSGVIISDDGYIVTNNHVIDGSEGTIMVTLSNRKTLRATLVGGDPNMDVAVLKIDAANLPFVLYGNSDDVKVGQWVLAVGYPLYLQVTATAGIVSAMGRNLGASLGRPARVGVNRLDSFIQTDAAVNLGNSGGPLVNRAGQLIGINTAMATPNGAYTGYSFAIPAVIVRRVVNELIAHGPVKKG